MAEQNNAIVKRIKPKPVNESRKIRKPLMERKRRNRINTSLSSLAKLLVEAKKVKADSGRSARLEKADILELTVQHLRTLSQTDSRQSSICDEDKFKEGFKQCIKVVDVIFKKSTSEDLKDKLLKHLHEKLRRLNYKEKEGKCENSVMEDNVIHEESTSDKEDQVAMEEDFEAPSEKASFILVPHKLPDGKTAFLLTGNHDFMNELQFHDESPSSGEIREDSIEYHIPKVIDPINIDYESSNVPQNNEIVNNIWEYDENFPYSHNVVPENNFQFKIPIQSSPENNVSVKSNSHIFYKTSNFLTPPPSPLLENGKNILQANVEHYNQNYYNYNHYNVDEPFDLRIPRMWRPW